MIISEQSNVRLLSFKKGRVMKNRFQCFVILTCFVMLFQSIYASGKNEINEQHVLPKNTPRWPFDDLSGKEKALRAAYNLDNNMLEQDAASFKRKAKNLEIFNDQDDKLADQKNNT